MPKDRKQNAHQRALATVAAIDRPVYNEQDAPQSEPVVFIPQNLGKLPEPTVEETALQETETEIETQQEEPEVVKQKPMGRPRKDKESTHRAVDEDFFDYLQRGPTPMDWSSVKTSGLYIYKLQSGGNLRIGPVLRRPITFDELKDIAIKHGPGQYKVQFQTRLEHLTPCGEVVPFDAESLPKSGQRPDSAEMKGFDKAIEASSNMLEHSAKTAIDLTKSVQIENNKQPDVAGIVTAVVSAVAALIPKQDNTMIQFLIQDAQRRADAAEKDADRREQRAKEDAERRERDSERRAAEAKAEADRQRERDKEFFGLMLKQAESKADSLNQMTGLLTSFMKVKETIDDTMGGGPKGPWDLIGQVAGSVIDNAPAIVAAVKGAPPAQVAQMQNPQAQVQQEAQPFYDMVIRLAKYFQRDPANYEGPYLVDMIEKEYGAVFSEIINQTKETILQAVTAFEPYGKAIMDHPQASVFMAKIIDAIKFPDTMDDLFPEEDDEPKEVILVDPKGVAHNPRQKRINGKAKHG